MKAFSLFPHFNRSQRRGIILLLLLIFVLQVVILFWNNLQPEIINHTKMPVNLQKEYDSLKQIALQKNKPKIYPFNPNYLTDYKAYYLGLSLDEIDRVNAYRKTGKYFQSKPEFKQVSGISDSLFLILEPYINIPSFKKNYVSNSSRKKTSTNDINLATADDLQSVNGLGPVLSRRIVKYRNAIGGFTEKAQLNKVYGLEFEVIERVWQKFKLNKTTVKPNFKKMIKKPINTATDEDLKKVYGIGDILANRIVKYRNSLGGFAVKEQLNDVYGLSPEVIDRIWEHFKIENPAKIHLKISLNDANIKDLAENPYISYQLAKKIVSHRTLNGTFYKFDDLLQVHGYPKEKHKQICMFLKL